MKKIFLIVAFAVMGTLWMLPKAAKADATSTPANTFFFMDGKGYDSAGQQVYFCFQNGSCYDLEGVFAFVRDAQTAITNLQNQVNNLQNTVNQLQTPTPQVSQPAAAATVTQSAPAQSIPLASGSTSWANSSHSISDDNGNSCSSCLIINLNKPAAITVSFQVLQDGTKPDSAGASAANLSAGFSYANSESQTVATYTDNSQTQQHVIHPLQISGIQPNSQYVYKFVATDDAGETVTRGWADWFNTY